jgi:hypothetical protein
MDDPYFDHKSAKRFDRQHASGPFGVDELLPKKITAWIQKKHPESGKKQISLAKLRRLAAQSGGENHL